MSKCARTCFRLRDLGFERGSGHSKDWAIFLSSGAVLRMRTATGEFSVQGLGFMVQVQGPGCRVQVARCRLQGAGFGGWGSGVRVKG